MRLFVSAFALLSASMAIAQTPPGAAPAPFARPEGAPPRARSKAGAKQGPVKNAVKTVDIPPDGTVVTVRGVCKDKQAKGPCETVVTRAELDKYISVFAPESTEAARARLAIQYAGALAFSSLAEQQGMDKNPIVAKEIETELKLVRMRILAAAFQQSMVKQPEVMAEVEIQKAYEKNKPRYEQFQVHRVSVPFLAPNDTGRPLDHEALKAEMEALRTRAAAGEDLAQLLEQAFKDMHIQATPPPLTVLTWRRDSTQGDEAKVFDLKPGEVTPVLDLAASIAFVKLESKESLSLAQVRPELEVQVRREHMQNEIAKATKKISTEFNLQFLGLTSQPDPFAAVTFSPSANARLMGRPSPAKP